MGVEETRVKGGNGRGVGRVGRCRDKGLYPNERWVPALKGGRVRRLDGGLATSGQGLGKRRGL